MPCIPGTAISGVAANQALAHNASILWAPWVEVLKSRYPWLSLLPNGTFPASEARSLRAPRQLRTNTSVNLAAPDFAAFNAVTDECNTGVDDNGNTEYEYTGRLLRQTSKELNLSTSFEAFAGGLMGLYKAEQLNVTEILNADVRYQAYRNSGVKAVVTAATAVEDMLVGTEYDYQTAVPAVQATARLTFALVSAFNVFMRTYLRATTFGGDSRNGYAQLFASPECLEALRNDLGSGTPGSSLITQNSAAAAGGDSKVLKNITGYLLTEIYRGIAFVEDPLALRLNWNGAGHDPVNPQVPISGTNGTGAVVSPGYKAAAEEVAFLVFEGSFRRDTLAPFTGEGKVRFAKQLWGGDIIFSTDNLGKANVFKSFGVLAYQVGNAFRPLHPEFILPIVFKRCVNEANTTPCTGVSAL
jgi:hypothetical protein